MVATVELPNLQNVLLLAYATGDTHARVSDEQSPSHLQSPIHLQHIDNLKSLSCCINGKVHSYRVCRTRQQSYALGARQASQQSAVASNKHCN